MKSRIIFFCLSAVALSCQQDSQQKSNVKAFASNLSDVNGKLPGTFLYLSEGGNVVQRECLTDLPRGSSDCPSIRSKRPLGDFRNAVQKDLDLSRTRLEQALESLNNDRTNLIGRKTGLENQLATLKQQLQFQGMNTTFNPGFGRAEAAFLPQALAFAKSEREKLKQMMAATSDVVELAFMQESLKQFDEKIRELEAKIVSAGGSGGGTFPQNELKQNIAAAEQSLQQVNRDLSGIDAKINATRGQQDTVIQENQILGSTIAKLEQTVIYDARDSAREILPAEKQLVSRFHKLFTAPTVDCNQRPVDSLKELAVGSAAALTSHEAQVGGSWHFGEVVKQMLGGNPNPQQAEAFMRAWGQHWQNDFRNGSDDRAAARPEFVSVIDQWKSASQARGIDGLDFRISPFRLIGIMNRFDLRNPLVQGDAGEARLVYALLQNPSDRPQDPGPSVRPFTVIFEYRVGVARDSDLSQWLGQWHDLGKLSCSNANDCQTYIGKLGQITRMFTHKQGSLLRSHLAQVRTNEIAFGNPWEQREFILHTAGPDSRLNQVDATRTPKQSLNNSKQLNDFVASISLDDLTRNNYQIPFDMRSAKAQVLGSNPEWRVAIDSERARIFNLNTCNGCHSSDQAVVDGFYHISPFKGLGAEAMSPFLLNQDLPNRAKVMAAALVQPSCVAGTPFDFRMSRELNRMLARPVH